MIRGTNPLVSLVLLKMDEREGKRCMFVTDKGCAVYEDRPWACRMFPLDLEIKGKYSFITDERRCKGLLQGKRWTVQQWLDSQKVPEYDRWNEMYELVTGDMDLGKLDVTNPQVRSMIFMATYDLDAFRRFVMESKFLDMFEIPEGRIELVKTDDLELLKLGMDWIRFGLFGEKTLKLKKEVLEARGKKQK
jgi:hypothetical protein